MCVLSVGCEYIVSPQVSSKSDVQSYRWVFTTSLHFCPSELPVSAGGVLLEDLSALHFLQTVRAAGASVPSLLLLVCVTPILPGASMVLLTRRSQWLSLGSRGFLF